MENEEKKSVTEEKVVLEQIKDNTEETKEEAELKEKGEKIQEKDIDKDEKNTDDKKGKEEAEKAKTKEEKKVLKKAEKKAKKEANKVKREEKRKNRSTLVKFFIGTTKIIVLLVVMGGTFVSGYIVRTVYPLEVYPFTLFNTEFNNSVNTSIQASNEKTDYGIIKNAGEGMLAPTIMDHLKVEELPYKFEVKAPDAAGNVYMNTTYTNNSKYMVKSYKLALLLKDSNQKVYAISDDTVPSGATSPNIESFGPNSQKPEDVEILKYDIVAVGQDGKEVKITYDVKLGNYIVK